MRRAALARVESVVCRAMPGSDRTPVAGFDLSYFSKPRLFGAAPPWLLVRFVSRIDADSLHDGWLYARRASAARRVPACAFVLSSDVASEQEVTDAVSGTCRRTPADDRVTVVPVDVRDWRVWFPQNAHPTVKSVAQSLQTA